MPSKRGLNASKRGLNGFKKGAKCFKKGAKSISGFGRGTRVNSVKIGTTK